MKKHYKSKILSLILAFSLLIPTITVPADAAKKKIKLNKTNVTLKVGGKVKLKVKNTKEKVKWKSNKKKVATVTKKGKVKAKKAGVAKITATVGKKKRTCKIYVVELSEKKHSLITGESFLLKMKYAKKKVKWTSSKTDVAIVRTDGIVTGKKAGTTTITGKSDGVKLSCKVTVSDSTKTPGAAPGETPALSLTASADTGIYDKAFTLTLTADEGTTVYYTMDGSIPTTNSSVYLKPLTIKNRNKADNILSSGENVEKMNILGSGYDYIPENNEVAKCTVLRMMSVDAAGNKSDVLTRTYFVGNDLKENYAGATIMSIIIEPEKLLDPENGIYVLGNLYDEWKKTAEGKKIMKAKEYWNYQGNYTQSGKTWERTADMIYIDSATEEILFEAPVGLRLHGGASRMYGQKSFNIYFREEYGLKNLKYPLIPGDVDAEGKQIKKYKSTMLRNGGNDTEYSKIRDLFIQNQVADRNYSIQATAPCVLFLNGEYWGLYNLTEKYSENSIEENYGVEKDDVMIFKEGELDEGKDEDVAFYEELWSYAKKDFTDQSVYKEFCNIMDIDSFADYYATEIYIANYDWHPEKNYRLWRTRVVDESNPYADGKWRYMVYDTEYSMGLYGHTSFSTNSFNVAMENDALFAAVMKNPDFQTKFLATIKEIGSVNFDYDICVKKLKEYKSVYKPLMQDFYTRFYGTNTWLRSQFDSTINSLDLFLENRYEALIPRIEGWCEKN